MVISIHLVYPSNLSHLFFFSNTSAPLIIMLQSPGNRDQLNGQLFTYQSYGSGDLVTKSCPTFAAAWTLAHQVPLSMKFSRQEFWSGLPCSSAGDLPNPGIEPTSIALQADSLLLSHQGNPEKSMGHA